MADFDTFTNGIEILDSSVATSSSASFYTLGGVSIFNTSLAVDFNNGGSLLTLGGISISKNTIIGGDTKILSTTVSSNSSTGSLIISGGVGINGSLNINNGLNVNNGVVSINSTTVLFADNLPIINYNTPFGTSDSGILFQRYQTENTVGSGQIVADTHLYDMTGTVQTGTTTTQIVLPSTANTTGSYYNNWWIKITNGAAINNVRQITAYNGGTKTATVNALTADPIVNTTTFNLYGGNYATIFHDDTLDDFIFGYTPNTQNADVLLTNGFNSISSYTGIISGDITIMSTTTATNTSTGALVVTGGAGVNGDIYGKNIYTNGTLANLVSDYNYISSAGTSGSTGTTSSLKTSLTTGTLVGGTYAINIGYSIFPSTSTTTNGEVDVFINGAGTTGTLIHQNIFRPTQTTLLTPYYESISITIGNSIANVGMWAKSESGGQTTFIGRARIELYRIK